MKRSDTAKKKGDANQDSPSPKIQVIARAATILRALEDQKDGLSLGEIALRVGLPRSTVQRIVTALAEEQFLIAASPKSRVKLGPALIRLAKATNIEINHIVRPYLENLCRKLEETVDLSVIQGRSAVFVDQIPGSHRLRAVSAIGERFPLHCTACGKALLATMARGKLEKFVGRNLESYTENTITDPEVLRKEIERVRRVSYAIDMEEYTEGICAIGVSFEDSFGGAYAISIPAPAVRFSRNEKRFRAAILECRDQIAAMLGDGNCEST